MAPHLLFHCPRSLPHRLLWSFACHSSGAGHAGEGGGLGNPLEQQFSSTFGSWTPYYVHDPGAKHPCSSVLQVSLQVPHQFSNNLAVIVVVLCGFSLSSFSSHSPQLSEPSYDSLPAPGWERSALLGHAREGHEVLGTEDGSRQCLTERLKHIS